MVDELLGWAALLWPVLLVIPFSWFLISLDR